MTILIVLTLWLLLGAIVAAATGSAAGAAGLTRVRVNSGYRPTQAISLRCIRVGGGA